MLIGKARTSKYRASGSEKYHQWLIDDYLDKSEPPAVPDHPIRIVCRGENGDNGSAQTYPTSQTPHTSHTSHTSQESEMDGLASRLPSTGLADRGGSVTTVTHETVGHTPDWARERAVETAVQEPEKRRTAADNRHVPTKSIRQAPPAMGPKGWRSKSESVGFSWRRFVVSVIIGGSAGWVVVLIGRMLTG